MNCVPPIGAEGERPGTGEAAAGAEEGEASDPDPGADHGLFHRLLAPLLLLVHPESSLRCRLPHPGLRLRGGLLARLHELRPQPGHLHYLQ